MVKIMDKSLSIIIPAYCEVNNLRPAFESVVRAVRKAGISDYEIILTLTYRPDGSDDGTPSVARALAHENPGVVSAVVDDGTYAGIGYRYRQGVAAATKEYVVWVPGDNETDEVSLGKILEHTGEADIIAVYTENKEVRAFKRRVISKGFVLLCNLLFGLHLKYYNGLCNIRRELLLTVPLSTDSFAFMAEILIHLIKSGATYVEVPMRIKPITNTSSSFNFKSAVDCSKLLARLFWNVQVLCKRLH